MREDDIPGRMGELIRHGRIASVDLAQGTVTIAIGEIETQPIRWYSGAPGATKLWLRPKVGAQVTVFAPDGDIVGAVALPGFASDDFPVAADPDRELVQFEDGAIVAYNPDSHALEVVLPAGATAAITAPGGVTITADVTISGDVTIDGKLSATGEIHSDDDVTAGAISLKDHKHSDVQSGGSLTGKPQ